MFQVEMKSFDEARKTAEELKSLIENSISKRICDSMNTSWG